MLIQAAPFREQLAAIGTELVDGVTAAIPKIVLGTLFLAIAYVGIKIVLTIARSVFERVYPPSQGLVIDLAVTVIGIFLWFGAALVLLNIVGLGNVAASLGTASGFIGLGVVDDVALGVGPAPLTGDDGLATESAGQLPSLRGRLGGPADRDAHALRVLGVRSGVRVGHQVAPVLDVDGRDAAGRVDT